MQMVGRHGREGDGKYRYGFQNQENDDEIYGEGNSQNYKYRMHNPRLGRFFMEDPLASKYPYNSPYAFSENSVIAYVELEGLEKFPANDDGSGSTYDARSKTHTTQAGVNRSATINDPASSGGTQAGLPATPLQPLPTIGPQFKVIPGGGGAQPGGGTNPGGGVVGATMVSTLGAGILTIIGVVLPLDAGRGSTTSQYNNLEPITGGFIEPTTDSDRDREKDDDDDTYTYYRAMSYAVYNATNGGYLQDRNSTGEGPHVRSDINYIENAKFINKVNSGYDIIVEYKSTLSPAVLMATPFQYTAGTGKGAPVFNGARNVGSWYVKREGPTDFIGSFGFPGASTVLFNKSLISKPTIRSTIK